MSKELEALEIVKKHLPTLYPEECGFDNIDGCFGPSKECQYELDIIETALKDYDQKLKLAKEYKDVNNVAKRLKALEIIKNKCVDIGFVKSTKNYKEYINDYEVKYLYKEEYILTKEEYKLLKEVLL